MSGIIGYTLEQKGVFPTFVAYLTDRLRIKEEKPPLYGTQTTYTDGKPVPYLIEDEANVDKRRAELGLPALVALIWNKCDRRPDGLTEAAALPQL